MKKCIAMVLCLLLVMAMLPLHLQTASAETSGQCGDGLYWSFDEETGKLTITGSGEMWDYERDYLPPWCPEDQEEALVKTVLLSDEITRIGDWAFSQCTNLTSISIPDSVNSIGVGAFQNCFGIDTIAIPDSITSISNETFSYCSGLTSFEIPANVTSIGDKAFFGCSGLSAIEIPASVTSIGSGVFAECSNLAEIAVNPNNTVFSTVNGVLFNYGHTELIAYPCGSPQTFYSIPDGVETISDLAFSNCNELTSVTFPNSVTVIGNEAFYNMWRLSSILLPESLQSIGEQAFRFCSQLTEISIPDHVTDIGSQAFSDCGNLSSITFGTGLINVGVELFTDTQWWEAQDNGLLCLDYVLLGYKGTVSQDITVDSSIRVIAEGAFCSCDDLVSIVIPNSVQKIGAGAFAWCNNLTSATLPDGMTSIPKELFSDCEKLQSVNLTDSVEVIEEYAFENCGMLESVTIPDSVTVIEEGAFQYCSGLNSVSFGDGLTRIGNSAFWGCSGITSLTFPDHLENIGDAAFIGCQNLTSITIPVSVTTIETDAFSDCGSLTDVYYLGSVEQKKAMSIGYSSGLADAQWHFATACEHACTYETWNYASDPVFTEIEDDDRYHAVAVTWEISIICEDCGEVVSTELMPENTEWNHSYENGVCVDCGHVCQCSHDNVRQNWYFEGDPVYTEIEGDDQHHIATGTIVYYTECMDCWQTISTEEPVQGSETEEHYYENGVCNGCGHECSHQYKGIWSYWSDGPFYTEIEGDNLHHTVTGTLVTHTVCDDCSMDISEYTTEENYIEAHEYNDNGVCTACSHILDGTLEGQCGENLLWTFDTETGILTITGSGEMSGTESSNYSDDWNIINSRVNEVILPDGLTSIGAYAFYNFTNLSSVNIPESITSIGQSAFMRCSGLTSIELPAGLQYIGSYAFNGCAGLSEISIPDSVTQIGSACFTNTGWWETQNDGWVFLDNVLLGYKGTYQEIVSLDADIRLIADNAFSNCDQIIAFDVDMGNMSFRSQEDVLYSYDMTELIAYPVAKEQSNFIVPDSVSTIKGYAFYKSSLTEVTLPEGLTEIGEYAFAYCNGLTEMVIPEGIAELPNRLFSYCKNLETVSIPESVQILGQWAFTGCESLKSVRIPDGVTSIYPQTFWKCYSLKEVTIPNSVTEIMGCAFSMCNELTDVYYLGTEAQRSDIDIDVDYEHAYWDADDNDPLLNATWHYLPIAFKSQALTLEGRIGVNFFIDLPQDEAIEYEGVSFTIDSIDGAETFVPFTGTDHPKNGSGYYQFTYYVRTIEMANTITATLRYTLNGSAGTYKKTYSVKQYFETFDQYISLFNEKQQNMVRATADLGHYVQAFLATQKGWTFGTDYAEMDKHYADYSAEDVSAAQTALSAYAVDKATGTDVQKITYSLVLDSDTELLVYFKPAAGYTGTFAFTVNGEAVTEDGDKICAALQSDGRYLVSIKNIAAHELNNTYRIVAQSDGGEAYIELSALTYANAIFNSMAGNDAAVNAVIAIYRYAMAANALRQ